MLKEHPVRKLFAAAEEGPRMEEELGLDPIDEEEEQEPGEVVEEVDDTKPLHKKVQVDIEVLCQVVCHNLKCFFNKQALVK